MFRAALFEQLGESRLEGAVTTDICGKNDAHATRLDTEAVDTIKKARLHRKVATTIFFESNGGQAKGEATVPEIRLAVAEPGLDIGNIETVLETLGTSCYYLTVGKNRYRFSLSPNLNKLLADRRASIQPEKIDERVRDEIQKVFAVGSGIERVFFPEKSGQIPDRPALTFVVLAARPVAGGGKADDGARGHHDQGVWHVFADIQECADLVCAGIAHGLGGRGAEAARLGKHRRRGLRQSGRRPETPVGREPEKSPAGPQGIGLADL